MLDCFVKIILAYLIGSVSGSLLVGRFKGVDIRNTGSGNAGGTNAFRSQGVGFALLVIIIDIGKGAVATAWIPFLEFPLLQHRDAAALVVTQVVCALAAVFGHIYPIYHRFRGGKGAATLIGAMSVLAPMVLLPAIGLWLTVLLATGYVGLATICAASVLPLLIWWLGPAIELPPLIAFGLLAAALVVHAHRGNIRRLFKGVEHRFEKARLVYWLK
jgi:glycerol-3-phosphate acyltransferase PlsY